MTHKEISASDMDRATAHYMALADEAKKRKALLDAGQKQADLIAETKKILFACVPPDGPSAWRTVCRLLSLLDGPKGREARIAWEDAISTQPTKP